MSATPTAATPTIDSVTTFVAELPGPLLDKVLGTFQGRRTPRTIAAAKRIAARKITIKVPRNLLRQLWRVTGGFKMGLLKPCTEVPKPSSSRGGEPLRFLQFGDMEVVFQTSTYGPVAWFCYRGTWCAKFSPEWDQATRCWLSEASADSACKAGLVWTPAAAPAP